MQTIECNYILIFSPFTCSWQELDEHSGCCDCNGRHDDIDSGDNRIHQTHRTSTFCS